MDIEVPCNTPDDVLLANIKANSARDLPWVDSILAEHDGHAVLVGGGPSLVDTFNDIVYRRSVGQKIFALNGAAKWLSDRGVKPDYQVIIDPRPDNTKFLSPEWADALYLASQCAPEVFEVAHNATLFHAPLPEAAKSLDCGKTMIQIGGGVTAGLTAMALVYALGFRKLHLYGYDSSIRDGEAHAYKQDETDKEGRRLEITCGGRTFTTSFAMYKQADQFRVFAKTLADMGVIITVHGDGLLPQIAREMTKPSRVLTAVYDLEVSPPTFDFLTFLLAAERAREKGGYDKLDVVIQPGPHDGFRADNLPPGPEMRRSMLWRVVIGALRLYPHLGNVTLLTERNPVEGDVFPEGWKEDAPVAGYGNHHYRDVSPFLRASDLAADYVAAKTKGPYCTITLRGSSYWPNRNSNLDAWHEAATFLMTRGFRVVVVPDFDMRDIPHAETMHEALFDLDVRAALYEAAALNLAVSSGPACFMAMLKCRFLHFVKLTDGAPCANLEYFKSQGWNENHQPAVHGRVVWAGNDDVSTIIPEITKELDSITN